MQEFCMAEGITFRYFEQSRRNILEHVSLSFKKGEVTVILGNSGCGKSTLASVLCGLYPENGGFLESGTVRIDGRELNGMDYGERSRYIAQMFQNPDLQFCMDNLREELRFCLENRCVPREEMDEQIERLSEKYGTSHLLDRPFFRMSGGEKQKAALCCLLLLNPRVMVLDEPFANLDKDARMSYMELLMKKVKEEETTVIAIDHRAENWTQTADRFLVLGEKGQVLKEGIPAGELYEWRDYLTAQGLNDPFSSGKAPAERKAREDKAAGESMIRLENVSVFHNRKKSVSPVLSGISLSAERGTMTACLGPSGGGKTSLFLALLGQKPYTGSMRLWMDKGTEISSGPDAYVELNRMKDRDLFARIGIVFQNPGNQFITMSVLDEVKESLKIWKKESEGSAALEAKELLALYGLEHYGKYSPYMLSQGQQRRLGVLAMLAGGQSLLLLDEPTYGQDGRTTRAIMEQMKARTREGLTVVFSTHDEQVAYEYADKIWHVEEGKAWEEEVFV